MTFDISSLAVKDTTTITLESVDGEALTNSDGERVKRNHLRPRL